MSIKITDKLLSIPPYISASWSQIGALHMKGSTLVLSLMDGESMQISHLDKKTIELIFEHHSNFLEKRLEFGGELESSIVENFEIEEPIRLAFASSADGFTNVMQHDPNQKDAPDLPLEVLQKIGAISKIMSPSEQSQTLHSEQGCNCFHCQIARVVNPENQVISIEDPIDEPEVSEAELHFQPWSILETGEKLYTVTNRLDDNENYQVFLGDPVGCTCGHSGCEHVLAVLRS